MSASRSLARAGRRRRLLTDQHLRETITEGVPTPSLRSSRGRLPQPANSVGGALMEQPPRIIDLAPRRVLTLIALVLAAAASVVAVVFLHSWSRPWAEGASQAWGALDITRSDSLSGWLTTLVLSGASCGCLGIFAVAKQHVEDYRARYRIWLWAAVASLVLSADITSGLHEMWSWAFIHLTGHEISGDGSLWWLMAAGWILVPLGLLLWMQMRSSALARGALLVAAILAAMACTCHVLQLREFAGLEGAVWIAAARLLACWCWLLAVLFQARQVVNTYCDPPEQSAENLSPAPARKTNNGSPRETTRARWNSPKLTVADQESLTSQTSSPESNSLESASPESASTDSHSPETQRPQDGSPNDHPEKGKSARLKKTRSAPKAKSTSQESADDPSPVLHKEQASRGTTAATPKKSQEKQVDPIESADEGEFDSRANPGEGANSVETEGSDDVAGDPSDSALQQDQGVPLTEADMTEPEWTGNLEEGEPQEFDEAEPRESSSADSGAWRVDDAEDLQDPHQQKLSKRAQRQLRKQRKKRR